MNEENPQYNQSQTQFSAEEPILETPPKPEPAPTPPGVEIPQKPKLPRWAWWAIGAVGLLLVLLVVAALMRPQTPEETVAEEEQREIAPEYNPFELRLRAAEKQLRETSPTSERFPFPPVSTELRIDQ